MTIDMHGNPYVTVDEGKWDAIARQLREPFDPRDVDFRVQGRANEQTGRAQVVAYVDARAVQDRLDAVVGIGNWSFDWQPLHTDGKGEVLSAKGTLTIFGVSKSDAGTASNFEATLGAVSHCFKRAAVHWGIGRYLYNIPTAWVTVEKGGRIPENVLRELRANLPRSGHAEQSSESEPQAPQQQTEQKQKGPTLRERAKAVGIIPDMYSKEVRRICGPKDHYTIEDMQKFERYVEGLERENAANIAKLQAQGAH